MAQLIETTRIANEPELRYTQGQNPQAVIELSLPCEYGRRDPQNNNRRPTQWVQATLWGKQAEALSSYLVKGQWVAVMLDDVHVEEFIRRDQTPGNKLVGVVRNIKLVGSAPSNQGQGQGQPSSQGYGQNQGAQQRTAPQQTAPQGQGQPPSNFDFDDDSIPF